ncbi:hypothetical protein Mth01_02700 [Sphaerimonospora thailandensis]|uniref:Uncharacterized protein n=2 Tax=Sphaerimonospora thailandensis TaxID=795644 RepID=A0A8J3R2T2_9ACTN|nr:hypothetical protein Mth01_02700 [Sphaerimonospora thailandensis]
MPSDATRLYQAVLRDVRAPISIRLRRAFSEWTVGKGFPPANPGSALVEHEANGARLRMERRVDCGRYVLDEPCDGGTLRTRVTYTESVPGMTGWVLVTVDQHGGDNTMNGAAQGSTQGSEQGPEQGFAPGFVPAYLRTSRITDGGVHLEDSPAVVDEHEVQRLVHALTEHRRRVPVVVVSVDAKDTDAARSRARYLSTATAGAAVVALLADLRAQDRFNQAMGAGLGVFGGGIRTYVAPFDPAEERYPYRHLPMGGALIRGEGERALDRAIDGIIGETARRTPPEDVQKTLRVVNRVLAGRAELREIAEAVTARGPAGDPAKDELFRRMMAKTVRPAPPTAAKEQATKNGAPPEGTETSKPSDQPPLSPLPSPSPGSAPSMVFDPAGLAQSVADTVVKELRTELESALSLALTSGNSGEESRGLSREIRTLAAHVAGLRDLVIERHGDDELLDQAEDDADRLAHDMETLRDEHHLLLEEYAEAVIDVHRLTERVRHLERKLAEAGRPMYGVAVEDDRFEPASLAETLIEARQRLTHLVILDTDAAATRLDVHHPALARTWAVKAWDALRALDDFAGARSAGRFAGGFYEWCANGSPGRHVIPVGMLSMRESQSVTNRPKFSDPRTFDVPTTVDPSGRLLMEAHVKLRPVGYPAPRMYFHDDAGGATGKIWIGYLGDHLPNTRTN